MVGVGMAAGGGGVVTVAVDGELGESGDVVAEVVDGEGGEGGGVRNSPGSATFRRTLENQPE